MQSKLSRIALAAVAGAMVTVSVAGTATAAGTAWSKDFKGRVTANGGLNVRSRPTTGSQVVGWHAKGSVVSIKCKVNGDNVGGNRLWYQLSDGTRGYSSARYIDNIGAAPTWCDGNGGGGNDNGGRGGNGGGGNGGGGGNDNGGRGGNGGGGNGGGGDNGGRGGNGAGGGNDNGRGGNGGGGGNDNGRGGNGGGGNGGGGRQMARG